MERNKYRIIQTDVAKEMNHGICVSNLAYRIAKRMELPEDMCYDLAVAGLLHDIGKLELTKYVHSVQKEENILHVEEMRYVRTHAALGYVILNSQGYSREIAEWVLYHHENYDGSGYPANKAGEEIPLGARILRVCDVFSALTSDRSYRRAFDLETAVKLMIAEVKNFDMKIFLTFLEVVHEEDIPEMISQQGYTVKELAYALGDMLLCSEDMGVQQETTEKREEQQ